MRAPDGRCWDTYGLGFSLFLCVEFVAWRILYAQRSAYRMYSSENFHKVGWPASSSIKRTRALKTLCCMRGSRLKWFHLSGIDTKPEGRLVVVQGWGLGSNGWRVLGFFLRWWECFEVDCDDEWICTHVWMYYKLPTCRKKEGVEGGRQGTWPEFWRAGGGASQPLPSLLTGVFVFSVFAFYVKRTKWSMCLTSLAQCSVCEILHIAHALWLFKE